MSVGLYSCHACNQNTKKYTPFEIAYKPTARVCIDLCFNRNEKRCVVKTNLENKAGHQTVLKT